MKLLKLILIIGIFLQCRSIAFGENGSGTIKLDLSLDTIKHVTKIKRNIHHKLPQPPTREQALKEMAFNDCMFVHKYSIAERLKRYPYSKAAKIIVVSYHCCWPSKPITIDDSAKKKNTQVAFKDSIFTTGLNVSNGELNHSSLIELKQLNRKQIIELTNTLYNTTYKRKNMIMVADPGAKCFNPRNAILFYDKNGKIFDYLIVCFECQRYESLSDKISIGTYCNQKYDLFKKFFIDAGINYGTIEK